VLSGATTFYEGKLDLSTYEEKDGAYFAVTCKVGEIGVKTTFNNRVETEIDINTTKTISGANLAHNPTWKNLTIPAKTIHYENRIDTESTIINESNCDSGRYHLPANKNYHFIAFKLAQKTSLNEFGDLSVGFSDIADQIQPSGYMSDEKIADYYQPIFTREEWETFIQKYGAAATFNISTNLEVGFGADSDLFPTQATASGSTIIYSGKYNARLVLLAEGSTFGNPIIIASSQTIVLTNSSVGSTTLFSFQNGTINTRTDSSIYLGILLENKTTYHYAGSPSQEHQAYGVCNRANVYIQTFSGDHFTMNMDSAITETAKADMLPVHEALNKIVEAISDNALSVKSNYYGRFDSAINPLPTTQANPIVFGNGSLKAITTGYHLRDVDLNGSNFNTAISFKNFIESLDAIDCIGWGFTTENGQTCLRVEKWDYFYNNTLVLTIDNPNKITRSLDSDRIITELTIGYKKYENSDETNSFEAIHSEHTYNNRCKAITSQKKKLSGFIADVYAIEETRRKQLQKESSDYKYDENFFIFEIAYLKSTLVVGSQYIYRVPNNYITQAQSLRDPAEWFNMGITPHRNAARWQRYLKWTNHTKEFYLLSGKMNTRASFVNTPPSSSFWQGFYLNTEYYMNPEEYRELETRIAGVTTPVKKEIVSITYPLTMAQYQSLRANPYGLIRVDSVDYYLQEASYKLKTGETELKLIPKNN